MDILEILKGRRSIRKYKSEQIKESELEKNTRGRYVCAIRNGEDSLLE